jgi:Tfp pilus tip-associated adhesin PilY1
MKNFNRSLLIILIASMLSGFISAAALADDTCAFMTSADDVPPNIVILLDNGAAMEEIIWHPSYDNGISYTPNVTSQVDVVANGPLTGNGFFNENGYSIVRRDLDNSGVTKYYLVDIPDSLLIANYRFKLVANGDGLSPTWTINGRTITLPAYPANSTVNGVIDKATNFRYSTNYLNWIFFGGYDLVGGPADGSDLPRQTRFYSAKQALMSVGKMVANRAQLSIYNFTSNASGASNVQPLGMVALEPLASLPENNSLQSNYINNINNMGTVTYSPLAEGLARVGGYYGSSSTHIVGYYCQKNFIIVVSPGKSSEDQAAASQSSPSNLSDFDNDNGPGGIGEGSIQEDDNTYSIPVNQNGSTYLDDVAYYLYSNDIVDYRAGFQNIRTYTVGFMGDHISNLFLINTSNNGNGNLNLYDTTQEEYGKYHFEAQDPGELAETILAAVNDIISQTSSFAAPVVPVTRTTSGNRIYMAFFTPNQNNFWEGNVTKFALSQDNTIVDANGEPATYANGALIPEAVPYWQTKDWRDPTKANYIHNSDRNIYTYFGQSKDLTDSTNAFTAANSQLDELVLGKPAHSVADLIQYVRGADVLDEDRDADTAEDRLIMTGDVLHSEPLVVQYRYRDNSSKTMVFFGANDGMLHAVLDEIDPDVRVDDDETTYGTEAWAYIPPDQLPRLRQMLESSEHQYYVDASPKLYFKDINGDGLIETDEDVNGDGVVDESDKDQLILICGQKKGASSYFALDVTDPSAPKYLWRISRSNCETGILELTSLYPYNGGTFRNGDLLRIWDGGGGWGPDIAAGVDGFFDGRYLRLDHGAVSFAPGQWIGNLTTATYQAYLTGGTSTPFIWGQIASVKTVAPDVIIPELGQSWSEPQFGVVKISDSDTVGTPVFFIGGGYSSDNSSGKAILAINVITGAPVRRFTGVAGMQFSLPSSVALVDGNDNGFVDKVYVGDLGGRIWRLGKFSDAASGPFAFPECDENVMNWQAQLLFVADPASAAKFYYAPSVTLEKGYDLIFAGTGDREDPCNPSSADRFYCIKDSHGSSTVYESELVDLTSPSAPKPDLDNATGDADLDGTVDQGWLFRLSTGEKVLAENTVLYKTAYFTTFTPNSDPCVPGGIGKIYALNYKTSSYVLDFDNNGTKEPSLVIGGGIPSKVVPVLTDSGAKLLISVGSTNPDSSSESFAAGVVSVNPLMPNINFFYLWWREIIKH